MKLKHVHIENFKGLKTLDIPFNSSSEAAPRRLTCLIGDNGSGKTTALQAIALTLSLATRRTRHPTDFHWHGFLPERVGSQGSTRVELLVGFDPEEVAVTQRLYQDWLGSVQSRQIKRSLGLPLSQFPQIEASFAWPGELLDVRLIYEPGQISSPQGPSAVSQFLGRYFVKELARTKPGLTDLFAQIGDVFWFDQYRNLGTILANGDLSGFERLKESEIWGVGIEQLREYLLGWWAYNTSEVKGQGKSNIKDLERRFAELFPGTYFRGPVPREGMTAPGAKDFYFLLEREGKLYDLAEMASGEQAVFTLLYDFIRLNIARSIVLIDELELHLHPPAQQALFAGLTKLGPDCQFIITTHSEFLTGIIPEEWQVRLEGGRRCL